ncbi:hypothetical protein Mp_7g07040 [Marchantia polymorpha subsp. ruderalis]|uniref:Uncharacterized protein n=2 Tax=Marchantia polymorpha TaxID=3197 RepID=A0AAF6BWY6_MARPO|nr:hypothetical protein MARPO_0076s0090 [Marchantia polymorpha]BBN16520.1 hypothetical protein Mp_7g07040 [Marchantia polymorpha subsp. ruderalis]|eukprot:PTQ34858.1 hypothetical protein MARPO_0076s0090 [Marchantia polymorpha]
MQYVNHLPHSQLLLQQWYAESCGLQCSSRLGLRCRRMCRWRLQIQMQAPSSLHTRLQTDSIPPRSLKKLREGGPLEQSDWISAVELDDCCCGSLSECCVLSKPGPGSGVSGWVR